MVESQFLGVKAKKKRKSRKKRENYTVILLNPCKAKGRSKKGEDFNKTTRIKGRQPIMGDKLFHNEDAIWLSAGR